MATWLCPGTRCTNQVTGAEVCNDCFDFLADLLEGIGVLWVRCRSMLPKGYRIGERVSVSVVGSPAPLNLSVYEAIEETYEFMVGWCRTVRVREGQTPDIPLSTITARFDAARLYLLRMTHTLSGSGLLTQFYNGAYHAHRRLRLIAGDSPETHRVHDPCPTCGCMTLISRHAGDYVTCLTCSGRWGQSAYLGLARRSSTSPEKTGVTIRR